MHESGKRETHHFFNLWNWTVLLISGLIIASFSGLVIVGLIPPGWSIFFISYFVGILLLDYVLAADVLLLRKRWKKWFQYRIPAFFLKKIKDDMERRYWKRYRDKRGGVYSLMFFYLLIFIIWGFLGAGNIEMAVIATVVLLSLVGYGLSRLIRKGPGHLHHRYRPYLDDTRGWHQRWRQSRRFNILQRKEERAKNHADHKKKDLERYKESHPKY